MTTPVTPAAVPGLSSVVPHAVTPVSPAPPPTVIRKQRPASGRLQVSAALTGGASHVATIAGGLYTLDTLVDIVRIVGTSAGALAAIGLAFGIAPEEVLALLQRLLAKDAVLDFGTAGGHGLCRWEVIRKAIRSLVGDAKMSDALIPLHIVVCDAYEQRPVVFSSEKTPHVLVHEAGTASAAIWPLADMQQVPSSGRGNRLFFDGGFARNLAADEFDGNPERPVSLFLVPGPVEVTPVRSVKDAAVSVLSTMLWSADHAHGSSRPDAVPIGLPAIGSGFNFNLTPAETKARWQAGSSGVLAAASAGAFQ